MFRFSTLLLLLVVLHFPDRTAAADCVFLNAPKAETGTVVTTWPARHVSDGDIGGCLLNFRTLSGAEHLAYAGYDFICQLKPEETIEMIPSYACCDAGDHGDFACGVKPRSRVERLPQTSMMLAPAQPDARAIPEMVQALLDGKLRNVGAARRLKEYIAGGTLADEVKKHLGPLDEAVEHSSIKDPYVKGAAADLLVFAYPASPKKTGWEIIRFQGDIGYALTEDQKSILVRLTADKTTAPRFIPVLVEKLRVTDDEGRLLLLGAIAAYGADAKVYSNSIRDALGSDIPNDNEQSRSMPSAPPQDPAEAARYEEMLKQIKIADTNLAARTKMLMPLLTAIVCHGETGRITVGKSYPTTIDCGKE